MLLCNLARICSDKYKYSGHWTHEFVCAIQICAIDVDAFIGIFDVSRPDSDR